jgi:hypothetical protein
MYHRARWTLEKIKKRLELIAPLVHIKGKNFPSFRYRELDNTLAPAPIGKEVDDSAWETNLLEENESELPVENDSIQLNLKPYQIMTLRVTFK